MFNRQLSTGGPLLAYAAMWGFDENDPTLIRAIEALKKLKSKELSSAEANAVLDPLIEAWKKKVSESPPRGMGNATSNSGTRLRDYAQKAGIDENDALLVRALKAEEKARQERGWMPALEAGIAHWAFMQGHFEMRNAWPPESDRIEMLLQKFRWGRAKPDEIEEFRRLASETFRDWQQQYSSAFKVRIESALKWLGGNPAPGDKMPDPFPQPSGETKKRRERFPLKLPPSKPWLAGVQRLGVNESHSVVARVMEILQKAEAGEINRVGVIEFHVLNEGLLEVYGHQWKDPRYVKFHENLLAQAKENLSDEAWRRLERMRELTPKIGSGTNSKEELEEQCRLYAEMDEKGLEP